MAKISHKDIQYLAKLAKLQISTKESDKYRRELSDILGYVDKVSKVHSDKELYSPQENSWLRPDEVVADDSMDILKNVPELEDDYIKVKAVLDQSDE